ncbi:MAG: C_GCAxxG_C_C family protein [Firmicutes bacterium]|nr:C_GCAxxG_C_C family protein [Bacillota bacterium]
MNDDAFRMFELYNQGFTCSQILLTLGLEARGETNPSLVRAVHGLAGGIGYSGKVCGALTGGACLIGLYAGRGRAEEEADEDFRQMIKTLVQWFKEEYGEENNSIDCYDILGEKPGPQSFTAKCATIVTQVYEKVQEILADYNYPMSGGGDNE